MYYSTLEKKCNTAALKQAELLIKGSVVTYKMYLVTLLRFSLRV